RLIAKYRAANGSVVGNPDLEEEDYVYDNAGDVIEIDETARVGSWGRVCTGWELLDGGPQKVCDAWAFQFKGTSTTTSKTVRAYDGLGRVRKVTGNNSQVFLSAYDLNGNLESTTDTQHHTTVFSYDHLDRKVGSLDAKQGFTFISYDAGNRTTAVSD